MKTIEIIPAIDLIGGKCVRLCEGKYHTKKEYASRPLEVAQQYENLGIKKLHLVDLDGAKSGRICHAKVVEEICKHTRLEVDFGGGIKSEESIREAFSLGVQQITCGSLAVKNPELVKRSIEKYGADRILLGADVAKGKIAINGWKEKTELDLFAFLSFYEKEGIRRVICTDISKDGMLAGPAFDLYRQILSQFPAMELIASGGVSSLEDLRILQSMGCKGVIIGKALYENRIQMKDLIKEFVRC